MTKVEQYLALSREEILKIKIDEWNVNRDNSKRMEDIYCNYIYDRINEILKKSGYKVIKVAREFKMLYGRFDFLVTLENDEYLIIEVKHSNKLLEGRRNDLQFSFSLGQLMTYKTSLCNEYKIGIDKVKLLLITNVDSILTMATIVVNNLPIDYMVVGDEVVKYYGCK